MLGTSSEEGKVLKRGPRVIGSIAGGIVMGLVGFGALIGSVHDPTSFKTFLFNVTVPFVAFLMSRITESSDWPDWTFWAAFVASAALWSAIIHFVRRRIQ